MISEENYISQDSFFFDSYAIFEILKGGKNYEKFKKCRITTTKLNIFGEEKRKEREEEMS